MTHKVTASRQARDKAANDRRIEAKKKPQRKKVVGTCALCGRRTRDAVVIKGKGYRDADGVHRIADSVTYDRECHRMMTRGLLAAGFDKPKQQSDGKPCGGCNQTIEADDNYAHRNGVPYHRECLV